MTTDISPNDVTAFWLSAGPEKWYKNDDALDAQIRERFLAPWRAARDGHLSDWGRNPNDALAFVILTDQFPRNMFRDDARAFATDEMARKMACYMINHGWDLKIAEPERQFVYLPFMHSERLTDQDHSVRLIKERMTTGNNLLHARAHRDVIRRFSRFPYRNAALGRTTTRAEQSFLDEGGYGAVVRALEAA
ncbi:MAG: DUF924 family protein [Pseudomonadota bacterium]